MAKVIQCDRCNATMNEDAHRAELLEFDYPVVKTVFDVKQEQFIAKNSIRDNHYVFDLCPACIEMYKNLMANFLKKLI